MSLVRTSGCRMVPLLSMVWQGDNGSDDDWWLMTDEEELPGEIASHPWGQGPTISPMDIYASAAHWFRTKPGEINHQRQMITLCKAHNFCINKPSRTKRFSELPIIFDDFLDPAGPSAMAHGWDRPASPGMVFGDWTCATRTPPGDPGRPCRLEDLWPLTTWGFSGSNCEFTRGVIHGKHQVRLLMFLVPFPFS